MLSNCGRLSAGARSVSCRTAIASGVPTREESGRSRELGRQDVLDHDAGAPVTVGSESARFRCDLEALRSQSGRNSVSSAATPRRRQRLAPIEGCRSEASPHGLFVPDRMDP